MAKASPSSNETVSSQSQAIAQTRQECPEVNALPRTTHSMYVHHSLLNEELRRPSTSHSSYYWFECVFKR